MEQDKNALVITALFLVLEEFSSKHNADKTALISECLEKYLSDEPLIDMKKVENIKSSIIVGIEQQTR